MREMVPSRLYKDGGSSIEADRHFQSRMVLQRLLLQARRQRIVRRIDITPNPMSVYVAEHFTVVLCRQNSVQATDFQTTNSLESDAKHSDYCVCGHVDASELTIACNSCGRQCHPNCVGIDIATAPDLSTFQCPVCPRYPARRRYRTPKAAAAVQASPMLISDAETSASAGSSLSGRTDTEMPTSVNKVAEQDPKHGAQQAEIHSFSARKLSPKGPNIKLTIGPRNAGSAKSCRRRIVLQSSSVVAGDKIRPNRPYKLISTAVHQQQNTTGWRIGGMLASSSLSISCELKA
eukprot:SAG31_NODE_380_length_16468_cov_8.328548_3_plen_291_part_00